MPKEFEGKSSFRKAKGYDRIISDKTEKYKWELDMMR
jgi:hypothetical protein